MHKSLEKLSNEEQTLLYKILIDIEKGVSTECLLNKTLIIKLLILKINHSEQFKELVGGYSSNTYYYERENLVLRFPKPYNSLFRHASIEMHNLSLAKKMGFTSLEIMAYYTEYSLLLTRFIPSYQSYSEKNFKNYDKLIALLAHLIKKLRCVKFTFTF